MTGSRTTTFTSVAVIIMFFAERGMAALGAGGDHACATVGENLQCWGYNAFGQLGRGDTEDIGDGANEMGEDLVPVDMGTGEIVDAIALGSMFTCALLESNTVKCFGKNDVGQLGQGDNLTRGDSPNELGDDLPAIDVGSIIPRSITAGCHHVCALLDDGSIKCFGDNTYGQLGQGNTDIIGDGPGEMGENLTAVDLGTSAKSVSAGCEFSCALTEDGTVLCWGRNQYGQLGTGSSENILDDSNDELVAVDLGGKVAYSIAAGGMHVCARLEDATVKCWGHNSNGQLGYGDTADRGDSPSSMGTNLGVVEFGTGSPAVVLEGGYLHSCVLLSDQSIKCFGDNEHGTLGIGTTLDVGDEPYEMGANLTAADLGVNATEVAAGEYTTCARFGGGGVKCWGEANHGQLGQGNVQEIGIVPGDLVNIANIDLGSEFVTAAPTPTFTVGPTSAEMNQSVEPTTSPTLTPLEQDTTRAPVATPAPTGGSSALNITDEGTSGSGPSGGFGGVFLATSAVCVVGLVVLLL